RRELAEAPRLGWVRRAEHEATALGRERQGDRRHDALVQRTAIDDEVLQVARTGVARSREHQRVAPLSREWCDRVDAEIWRDRRGVRVERVEERVGVGL